MFSTFRDYTERAAYVLKRAAIAVIVAGGLAGGEALAKPVEAQGCANCVGSSGFCPFGYLYIRAGGSESQDPAFEDYCWGTGGIPSCYDYYLSRFPCGSLADVDAMIRATDDADYSEVVALMVLDERWEVNAARNALQVRGCDESVIASIPLKPAALAHLASNAAYVAAARTANRAAFVASAEISAEMTLVSLTR